ncbi:MAG: LacI family DNA-binding transcriptional regulator [Acetatifactor muris]|nr:LacI family DNA-binding transcriptional regulator [Acetatifactor muris]
MKQEEIARQLGLSKSTVSRALSGKGRIGGETRIRIQNFIRDQDLKQEESKKEDVQTKNLGVVFPSDIYMYGHPYFQECLLGIYETASLLDYNIMIAVATAQDISGIRKMVEQKKVDGIFLTRSLEDDRALQYLLEAGCPVGLTGLCEYPEVIQVDINNERAAESLLSLLIGKGFRRFALVVDNLSFQVNRSRYNGFNNAILKNGLQRDKQEIYIGKFQKELCDSVIQDMMAKRVECVVCGDDILCSRMFSRIQAMGYRIPRDIAVASLYNSSLLDSFLPLVTAVNSSARTVGNVIGKQMIQSLQGKEYQKKIMVDYEILMRKSTEK